ncbi:MAG: hypothetical protein AAFV87_19380 [Pseudomonadota bacterium]
MRKRRALVHVGEQNNIVASSEDAATASIREIEDNNRALGEYWAE